MSNPGWDGGMVVVDIWLVISCQSLLDACPRSLKIQHHSWS